MYEQGLSRRVSQSPSHGVLCTWKPVYLSPALDSGLQVTQTALLPCCASLDGGTQYRSCIQRTCEVTAGELTIFSLKSRILRGSNQLSSCLASGVIFHFPFLGPGLYIMSRNRAFELSAVGLLGLHFSILSTSDFPEVRWSVLAEAEVESASPEGQAVTDFPAYRSGYVICWN